MSTIKPPGSLGATATIAANVLTIEIADSDTANIEPTIVTDVGIAASTEAAPGSIHAVAGTFSGFLAGGAVNDQLPSPGMVAAAPCPPGEGDSASAPKRPTGCALVMPP